LHSRSTLAEARISDRLRNVFGRAKARCRRRGK